MIGSCQNESIIKRRKIDMDENQLMQRLQLINGWITNCDQKAGLLLALIGVLFPIILTTDIIVKKIKDSFIIFDGQYIFENAIFLFSFLVCISCLVATLYFLLSCLEGKINGNIYSQEHLNSNSLIFFQTIAKRKFIEYERDIEEMDGQNLKTDYLSQIYINSKICTEKFQNYNIGLKLLKYTLLFLLIIFIQVI